MVYGTHKYIKYAVPFFSSSSPSASFFAWKIALNRAITARYIPHQIIDTVDYRYISIYIYKLRYILIFSTAQTSSGGNLAQLALIINGLHAGNSQLPLPLGLIRRPALLLCLLLILVRLLVLHDLGLSLRQHRVLQSRR